MNNGNKKRNKNNGSNDINNSKMLHYGEMHYEHCCNVACVVPSKKNKKAKQIMMCET